jgi:transglutaminase-like putative cysteine protease
MATTRPVHGSAIALTALSAATALTLTRVFADARWLVAIMLCVALAHGIGILSNARQWSGPRTALAHLVVGFLVTLWIVVPDGTVAGIPTASGIADWFHAFSRAIHVLRTAVVPVPANGAALLLALVALWAAAAASQWSAARLDGILGAMVPQLALFVAIGALGKGAYVWQTMLWAGAAAAFLLTAHLERLTNARTWFQTRASHPSRLVTGGAAAAVVAVLVAAVIGPHLPGSGHGAWLDYRHSLGTGAGSGPGTISAISPLVDIGSELNSEPAVTLFTVQSPLPQRWRQVALDDFDGVQWTLNERTSSSFEGGDPVDEVEVQQHYDLTNLGGNFLPAAYRTVRVDGSIPGFATVPDSATVVVSAKHGALRYTVTSLVPSPSAQALQDSAEVDPNSAPDNVQRALALPPDLSHADALRILAQNIVNAAGARTPYDKALAIQNYLRDPKTFTYDQHIPAYTKSDALYHFLFVTHRGFCQQFAGAFGALAREVGLPTRLAVGFLPGEQRPGNVWRVTTKDAHAWPEVYFDGVGWLTFEPTPSRFDNTSVNNYNQTAQTPASSTATTVPGATTTVSAGPLPTLPKERQTPGLTVAAPHHGSRIRLTVPWIVLFVILGIAALVFGGARVMRALRRWQRRRVTDPRGRVLGAWAETIDLLAAYNITRPPSRTPVEFAMRDAPALGAGDAGPALVTLARLSTAAMYGPDEPSSEDADSAWQCERAVASALKEQRRRRRGPRRGSAARPRGGAGPRPTGAAPSR